MGWFGAFWVKMRSRIAHTVDLARDLDGGGSYATVRIFGVRQERVRVLAILICVVRLMLSSRKEHSSALDATM